MSGQSVIMKENELTNGSTDKGSVDKGDEDQSGLVSSVVTPDMLYKLSKKIAQLTKVIYSLNTRNDDLEVDLDAVRSSYEEKLQMCQEQLQIAQNHTNNRNVLNGGGSPNNHEVVEATEAKSALDEAVHALKLSENKLKSMEQEMGEKNLLVERLQAEALQKSQQQQLSEASCQTSSDNSKGSPTPGKSNHAFLEQQVKQLNKDKKELTFKIDRLDVINESFRLETETLRKELKEMTSEKNKLQLELSAARIQINYDKEVGKQKIEADQVDTKSKLDDQFTDELIEKVETLSKEKADLCKALEEAKVSEVAAKKQVEVARQERLVREAAANTKNRGQQTESSGCEECKAKSGRIEDLEAQVGKLQGEKADYESRLEEVTKVAAEAKASDLVQHESLLADLRSETLKLQAMLERESEKSHAELELLSDQLKSKQADLEAARQDYEVAQQKLVEIEAAAKADREALLQTAQAEKESLSMQLSESKDRELQTRIEMGQNSEKLCAIEERCKSIEKERDDLKRKCKEIEAKMDVLSRSEQAAERDANDRLVQLEKALEEALIEREEILEAAEKEIQAQKTIALETEQKMMDDFEWKLREIESEYRDKIKLVEDSVEAKVKAARDELVRQKDEEFTRMSISMRREMEDKIRLERNALKVALDSQNSAQRDKAIELHRLEKDHEIRILQKSWEDEQARLNREIQKMQRKVDGLPHDIEAATRSLRSESDLRVQEERRKLAKVEQKHQEEMDKLRDDMNGEILRVQARCDERIADYESKLEAAHGKRMSSMFQMKEEVEGEFTERMEQLRDMYMHEMELQNERLEVERQKAKDLEESLRLAIQDKQQEIDDLNTYYVQREEELEEKINDLLTRLRDQTAIAVKLQNELDEYEWYEEEEEGAAAAAAADPQPRPPSSSHHRPHSRPPSVKPLEQYRYLPPSPEPQPIINQEEEEEEEEAEAATTNYASMTSLYATAPTSTASEVSSSSGVSRARHLSSPQPPPRTRMITDSSNQPPLAEEAFLPTSSSEAATSMSGPSKPPEQPQQHTADPGSVSSTSSTATTTPEDEEDNPGSTASSSSKPNSWPHRLLKSASGVLGHRSGHEDADRQKRNSSLMANGSSSKKSQCSQQ